MYIFDFIIHCTCTFIFKFFHRKKLGIYKLCLKKQRTTLIQIRINLLKRYKSFSFYCFARHLGEREIERERREEREMGERGSGIKIKVG